MYSESTIRIYIILLSFKGDIICDPMCGGGSIPLEGAHSLPGVFNLGGDNHSLAVTNAGENIESYSTKKSKEGYVFW